MRSKMSPMYSEDASFVVKCQAGQADAFEPLVRRYQNAAYAIALNYVRNPHDAQDIVQEAFIAAYCKLGQLRHPAVFSSWLRTIVITHCKEWLRRQRSLQGCMSPLDADFYIKTESGNVTIEKMK